MHPGEQTGNTEEIFLTPGSIKLWDSLPEAAVDAKLLGAFETRLDKVLERVTKGNPPCLGYELNKQRLKNPKHFLISV